MFAGLYFIYIVCYSETEDKMLRKSQVTVTALQNNTNKNKIL